MPPPSTRSLLDCPFGEESNPLRNDMTGDVWTPILDSPNSWISNLCVKYSSLHNSPPYWGLTGGAITDMTPQIMCCREPDDHAIAGMMSMDVAIAKTKAEEEIMEEWDPVWFSAKHGYRGKYELLPYHMNRHLLRSHPSYLCSFPFSGTSYQDAINFCKNIADMVLCPKKAYCSPYSEMHLYLQREPFEGDQWAPVASENGTSEEYWISIGEDASVCATHEELLLPLPEWITDGSEQESKQNVLCCQNPHHLAKEQSLASDLDPIWVDGAHGWSGGSHDDANKFCESFNFRRLCPYSAYCPHGLGQEPMGGHTADFNTVGERISYFFLSRVKNWPNLNISSTGEMWAPLLGTTNHWVMIGQKYQNRATTCMDNYQLEGEEPSWGLSNERPEMKSFIMCCYF